MQPFQGIVFKSSVVTTLLFCLLASPAFAAAKESVYDRVMRRRTLRCGYFEEVPFTNIDPNTNKKSGIAVELAETLAAQLDVKLEWTEAVNFGTIAH